MILMIEDETDLIKVIKIKYKNKNIFFCQNLEEALLFYKQNRDKIELIICDHNFPKKNSYPIEESGLLFFNEIKNNYNKLFIHFSANSCPQKYALKNFKGRFETISKDVLELKNFIK